MKGLWSVLVALVVVVLGAAPAHAGGAVIDFERPYRPGERAFGWTSVAWDHNGGLGRPADGPYHAYLLPGDMAQDDWPSIPAGAVYVGDLVIRTEPYEAADGFRYGPYHATLEFVVPDLPPGEYWIAHCNDPCTTTLGDIIGGRLTIRAGPPTTTTPTTTPPTTTAADDAAAPLVADEEPPRSEGPLMAIAVVGAGLVLAGFGLLLHRLHVQPTANPR